MTTYHKKGFTLVETMISVSIITLIMGVILFNYYAFSDNLALSSAGQEVAIAIRQAQTYGLSVKEVAVGGGQFSYAYGVYFNTQDPTNYYLYVDTDKDYLYDFNAVCGNGTTECYEKVTLRNGIRVSGLCDNNGDVSCPLGINIPKMNITFLRPNPDAKIYFTNNVGGAIGPFSTGKVILSSPGGKTLTITVQNTGQVLVGQME